MGSQVLEVYPCWQYLCYQLTRGLREQDLPTVPGTHDAGRVMHVQANVALSRTLWFAGVQAHAHAHRHPIGPGMGAEGALGGYRSRDGIAGARKGDEEAVPLGIDLVTIPLVKHCP